MTIITTEAVFEDGVLRPVQTLPLAANQRVKLIVHVLEGPREWPDEVANLYREIAHEDRRIAAAMEPGIRQTWPASGDES